MILGARKQGIGFEWVGGDGFCGHGSELRHGPDDVGEFCLPDIHSNQCIYLRDPAPSVPEKKPGKGRAPSRYQSDIRGITAESLIKERDESEWNGYCSGTGTKGKKKRKAVVTELMTWNGEDSSARSEKLIVGKNPDGKDAEYSLCDGRQNRHTDPGCFICRCGDIG